MEQTAKENAGAKQKSGTNQEVTSQPTYSMVQLVTAYAPKPMSKARATCRAPRILRANHLFCYPHSIYGVLMMVLILTAHWVC